MRGPQRGTTNGFDLSKENTTCTFFEIMSKCACGAPEWIDACENFTLHEVHI
jgi:hypothetical protein